eukprot:6190952-Heterocapsa_arctica.AAC.1
MASARPRMTSPRSLRSQTVAPLVGFIYRCTWAGLPGAWVRAVCWCCARFAFACFCGCVGVRLRWEFCRFLGPTTVRRRAHAT